MVPLCAYLLATAQGQTLFTDLSLVAGIEQREIPLQGTLLDDLVVTVLIEGCAEQNVVLQGNMNTVFRRRE